MKQNTSNSAKKGARRGAGQAVAAMVMALAVAVGGVGTTALLAAQPVGLTVEPSTIQWEDDSTQTSTHQNQKKQEQKKPTVKAESEAATEQPAESKAESTAASVEEKAESAAPSVSEAASSEAAPSEPAQEPAPADPMAGDGTGLEQENAFPVFQQETDELAAEDPLSPRVENTAMDGAADAAVSTAGVNSVEDALAEAQIKDENGTILLTPEEIRAALDAGTLDEDSIDAQCLADENGLLSWLWKWLFGKKEDNTPAPVYSGWRTVNGKTCREIGASSSFRSKVENNDVWKVHQRAYKKYYARTMRKDMTKAEFEAWTRDAEQKRDAALEPYARAESEKERQRIAAELEEKLNRL